MKLPENTEFEWAVWALVTCEIDGKKYAILQKRTADDSFPGCLQVTIHGGLEKKWGMKTETNRAERESMIDGLKRETVEEVTEMISRSISLTDDQKNTLWNAVLINVGELTGIYMLAWEAPFRKAMKVFLNNTLEQKWLITVSRKTKKGEKTARKTDATFWFHISGKNNIASPELMPTIQQLAEDWVIVLLSSEELEKLVPLEPKLHKKEGITEEGKYGMFQDEIDAVKKALGVAK